MSNPACAEGNHRKIIDQSDSTGFGTSNGQTYSNCEHRFVVNVMVSDETGGSVKNEIYAGVKGKKYFSRCETNRSKNRK